MYNKVEICGVNTANLKVLSESEKMRLLKLSREGDKKAREELVNGNPVSYTHLEVVQESFHHPDIGSYAAFGIAAYRKTSHSKVKIAHIPDISADAGPVEALATLCNALSLDPLHLPYVVEDILG